MLEVLMEQTDCFVGKREDINLRKYTLVLYCLLVGICPDVKAKTV